MTDNTLIQNALASVNEAKAALEAFLNAAKAKKPVGINVAYPAWYASRQTWRNLLQGGYWADSSWKQVPSEQLDKDGYPLDWSKSYVRLMSIPTGGWIRDTKVVLTWKGTGTVTVSGPTNIVKGDHRLEFTIPAWGGQIRNKWISVYGVDPKDPIRDMEMVDADPANATDHQFSKEIVGTLKPYHTSRFMDWNDVNANIARTMANIPNPKSLDRPHNAIENQIDLCNLTDCDFWFNLSWMDDPAYGAWAAKTARARLAPHLKVNFELSNEVWNWQFQVAHDNLAEATALKINPNNGYGAWQNYSRRFILAVKPWEDAFADQPKRLVRVLGTQVAYPEVTRQELKYPGILDHIDAIAGAPYFSHDRTKPFTWDLLEANIEKTAADFQTMCDIARAAKPDILCYLYEGGQHELPTSLLPQADFEAIQRDPRMGALYTKYLEKMTSIADLTMQYYDVGSMSSSGAWGLQEYGGQPDAPKQIAVAKFLAA